MNRLKYFFILLLIVSCAPADSRRVYRSAVYETEDKTKHISFFNGVVSYGPDYKRKNGLLILKNNNNKVVYFCKNDRNKIPIYKVNYITDSVFEITGKQVNRYTVLDSVLFKENYSLYKRVDFDQHVDSGFTKSNFMSRYTQFCAFEDGKLIIFSKQDLNDKYEQPNTSLLTEIDHLINNFRKKNIISGEWQKREFSFGNDAELQKAKMEFFRVYVNPFF